MRKSSWWLALVAVVAFHAPTRAELLTPDAVPAATLLLPYFEVDLDGDSSSAITTLFSINNASAAPALAHVVLWTDLGVPTFTFDVFLTGYDVQRLSLRDVFVDGLLPLLPFTLSDGGAGSTCEELNIGQLTEEQLTHIQAAHTGQASQTFGNQCSGFPHGDNIARGYVTIDNVSECSTAVPGDEGYFVSGGEGIANNFNQLWGDYSIIDPGKDLAHGEPLVHIEAEGGLVATGGAGTTPYTFYTRLVGATGADGREPLPSVWATRYFHTLTDLICWRDPGNVIEPFSCESTITGLSHLQIVFFDHQEDATELTPLLTPCGLATTRETVGGAAFPVTPKTGWLFLNLNHSEGQFFTGEAQSYVTALHTIHPDVLSVGMSGIALGTIVNGGQSSSP